MSVDLPLVTVIVVVKNGGTFCPPPWLACGSSSIGHVKSLSLMGNQATRRLRLRELSDGARYFYQHDLGLAKARNLAVRAASGEFIAFLDSDDIWAPTKLTAQMSHLLAHPDIQGVVTWLRFLLEPEYEALPAALTSFNREPVIGYTPSALVARKRLFSQIGP